MLSAIKIEIEVKPASQQGQQHWYRASVLNIDLFKGFESDLTKAQRDLVAAAIDAQGEALKSFASRIAK